MITRKKVLVNGSMIDEKPTGVGIVSINILKKLSQISKLCFEITIYVPVKLNIDLPFFKLSNLLRADKHRKLAAIARFMWNQINLSFYGKKFDICYSPTTHASLFLKNQIITIHDLICLNYPNNHRLQYYYFKLIVGRFVKNAKHIITISEFVKNDIVKFYNCDPRKISVVYNGFDRTIFQPNSNSQPPLFIHSILKERKKSSFILSVGATYKHKNIESALHAFYHSISRETNVFIIVGGYPNYLNRLQKLVRKLNIVNDVVFLHYVNLEDLVELYNNAKLLVYLSLYEGFGLPLLEALSCNCSILASDISIFHEICGDNCEYVNPLDISNISKKIDEIIVGKSKNTSLDKSLFEKYTWENSVKKILEVINSNF